MPRYARQLCPSGVYHVMVRGNEKKDIFLDDEDRSQFLFTLERMKKGNKYSVYAFCLMKNHVHLLIGEGDENISLIMKRLSVSYAYYFNKKYSRVGHLFQDRFRSETIDNNNYLLAAARYIHNNPVKAGIVQKPDEYAWSSYKYYTGHKDRWADLVSCAMLLEMFSGDGVNAVSRFVEFSQAAADDVFIDLGGDDQEEVGRYSDPQLLRIALEILGGYGQSVETLKASQTKEQRDKLIREIKTATRAPARQLSRVLGIGKDTVCRA